MSSWIICWELCCCFWICSESCCIWLSHSWAPSGACNPPRAPSAFIAPPLLLDWTHFMYPLYLPLIKSGHTCRVSLEAKMAQMLLFGTKLPSVTSLQAAGTKPPPTAFRHGAIIQHVFSFGLLYRYLLFPAPLRQRVRP